MSTHKFGMREFGLGNWIDKPRPVFLDTCTWDDSDDTCDACIHKQACAEYFQPLAETLEKMSQAPNN